MSLANWNVKEKEKFSVVANPVFCFSFSFLFFLFFFRKAVFSRTVSLLF